jgi:two-component system, OmpR family, sensor histidine kinase VicK
MNHTRPQLAIMLEPIRRAFLDAKRRNVNLRYLTEITKDNISYCKQLVSIINDLRHLEGIKGNFMISESEYLAPVVLFEEGKVASQIIYSNVKEIVEQQQYTFDTFWNRAIPAEQRIKEIEEGTVHYETRLIENPEEVAIEIGRTIDTVNEIDDWAICSTFGGLQMIYNHFGMQKRAIDNDNNNKNNNNNNKTEKAARWIGDIDKDSIDIIKTYLDSGMQIRHVKNMPPMNFAVSPNQFYATIDEMKGGQMAKSLLISNEPPYIKHFSSIFEELWKNGIDAAARIREIEEGIESTSVEITQNPKDAIKHAYDIVKSAKEEVLRIFSYTNAFHRQVRIGVIDLFNEVAKQGVKVRILIPADQDQIREMISKRVTQLSPNIEVRSLDKSLETSIGILVVDRKESLIIETKDDTKANSYDAAGLSVFSNSKPIALSFASIFESLWKQSEMYEELKESKYRLELANEQLKVHDKIQNEFINVAAHELRTPIQPILGLTAVLHSRKNNMDKEEQWKLLDVIRRNANRLQRLTEDILDVTKIESQSLKLNKEQFDLNEVVSNTIADYKNELKEGNSNIKLELVFKGDEGAAAAVLVEADKARLSQVIANILGNAIKFTKEGCISIVQEVIGSSQILISIKDTGSGIDPEIMPRLFTKFATKSQKGGTGLGLFISKGIIEAHNGRIWAENNTQEKGATFHFSLPISKKSVHNNNNNHRAAR